MNQKTYFKKFSRIVRWTLPKAEADETLSDYEEILSRYSGEKESALVADLGDPLRAAKQLVEPRTYHRWLWAFGGMLFCLLIPELWLIKAAFSSPPFLPLFLLLLLGAGIAFFTFLPRHKEEKAPLPKGLFPALGVVLLAFAAVLVAAASMTGLFSGLWTFLPPERYGMTARLILLLAGTVSALFSVSGLVLARLSDRHWCALYLLGATVLMEAVLVLSVLCSLSLDTSVPYWWTIHALKLGVLGAAGLAVTGKALC